MKAKNLRGTEVLQHGGLNKSTGFSSEERDQLGLRGLLPYKVSSLDSQVQRTLENIRRKESDIERYVLLGGLLRRNKQLFYRTVIDNIDELLPLIYTPTVGQACKEFSHIWRETSGFYITPEDKGNIAKLMSNWPEDDVRAIVVTDGQRILGLGDLGANGMGIPIGKLSLYTACGGIPPHQCMPVMLDVGTNNDELLEDMLYLGYPHKRIDETEYDELVDEFVQAVQTKYPKALIQFEDFLTPNAYKLLNRYRDNVLCFNDDIQGTAAVALAGVYASGRITGNDYRDLRIMFLGAGSAATGIADLMTEAFIQEGLSRAEALQRVTFVDLQGLLVTSRKDLMPHNLPYANDYPQMRFLEAIEYVKPHVLIGATGAPNTFTREVIEKMSQHNERPVVFALSNPTSRAECTAEQAYHWSNGKVVFASGSPFDDVIHEGKRFSPGQGNNAYVFPGIGLGALSARARKIPDHMFLCAARTLAAHVSQEDIDLGALYPPLRDIRRVSLEIASHVAAEAYRMGLAQNEEPENIRDSIEAAMYNPRY